MQKFVLNLIVIEFEVTPISKSGLSGFLRACPQGSITQAYEVQKYNPLNMQSHKSSEGIKCLLGGKNSKIEQVVTKKNFQGDHKDRRLFALSFSLAL